MHYVLMLTDKQKSKAPIYVGQNQKQEPQWSFTLEGAMHFHSEMEIMQVLNWIALSAPLFEESSLFDRVNDFSVSWYKSLLAVIPKKYVRGMEFVIAEITITPKARFPFKLKS